MGQPPSNVNSNWPSPPRCCQSAGPDHTTWHVLDRDPTIMWDRWGFFEHFLTPGFRTLFDLFGDFGETSHFLFAVNKATVRLWCPKKENWFPCLDFEIKPFLEGEIWTDRKSQKQNIQASTKTSQTVSKWKLCWVLSTSFNHVSMYVCVHEDYIYICIIYTYVQTVIQSFDVSEIVDSLEASTFLQKLSKPKPKPHATAVIYLRYSSWILWGSWETQAHSTDVWHGLALPGGDPGGRRETMEFPDLQQKALNHQSIFWSAFGHAKTTHYD